LNVATILIVCTGNICRSPMAEGLLDHLLRQRRISSVSVESAGTAGWEGSKATREAIEAMRAQELDISGHAARRLQQQMIEGADLVVAMSGEHLEAAVEMAPGAADRSFTLKELVRLLDRFPGHKDLDRADERLREAVRWAAAARATSAERGPQDDVPDPLGLSVESFRATAWELGGLCERLVDGLFGQGWEERIRIDSAALWG